MGSTRDRWDWLAACYYGYLETFAQHDDYWVRWGAEGQTDSGNLKGHEPPAHSGGDSRHERRGSTLYRGRHHDRPERQAIPSELELQVLGGSLAPPRF